MPHMRDTLTSKKEPLMTNIYTVTRVPAMGQVITHTFRSRRSAIDCLKRYAEAETEEEDQDYRDERIARAAEADHPDCQYWIVQFGDDLRFVFQQSPLR